MSVFGTGAVQLVRSELVDGDRFLGRALKVEPLGRRLGRAGGRQERSDAVEVGQSVSRPTASATTGERRSDSICNAICSHVVIQHAAPAHRDS